jgi:hypothetical protein
MSRAAARRPTRLPASAAGDFRERSGRATAESAAVVEIVAMMTERTREEEIPMTIRAPSNDRARPAPRQPIVRGPGDGGTPDPVKPQHVARKQAAEFVGPPRRSAAAHGHACREERHDDE